MQVGNDALHHLVVVTSRDLADPNLGRNSEKKKRKIFSPNIRLSDFFLYNGNSRMLVDGTKRFNISEGHQRERFELDILLCASLFQVLQTDFHHLEILRLSPP